MHLCYLIPLYYIQGDVNVVWICNFVALFVFVKQAGSNVIKKRERDRGFRVKFITMTFFLFLIRFLCVRLSHQQKTIFFSFHIHKFVGFVNTWRLSLWFLINYFCLLPFVYPQCVIAVAPAISCIFPCMLMFTNYMHVYIFNVCKIREK